MDGVRLTEKGKDWLALFICFLSVIVLVLGAGFLGNYLMGY